MKRIFTLLWATIMCLSAIAQPSLLSDTSLMQPVEVIALKAGQKVPVAKTDISRQEIEKSNTGRDIPFLLSLTPSVVTNSDAGNGIGYTGIRIRGTDASRINITINNIPYNDAESQGTFFVNIPDIAASASAIQVQRGAGTSTNGAGAFGASVNISTNEIVTDRKLVLENTAGSFGTLKNSLQFNSGLMKQAFTFDARISRITSEGYIDRAFSNLFSAYTSAAYIKKNYSARVNIFTGKEKTYQAWYGIPQDILTSDRTYNAAGTEKPGAPYDNETDNYHQTHYQFFQNMNLSSQLKTSMAVFLTRGKGFYEQYKTNQALADYGLPSVVQNGTTIDSTDLIRQLWLDNYFYGVLFNTQYKAGKHQILGSAGWTQYDGKHFGEIKESITPGAAPAGHHWYDLTARKYDITAFGKWQYEISKHLSLYADVQGRHVDYDLNGFRNNPQIKITNTYFFLNPKAGITYSNESVQAYVSYAKAAKEPNRDDFEAGINEQPRPEILHDFESGIEWKQKNISLSVNAYYMYYINQLVLTGKINDVGAYTRSNIPKSYRAGVELSGIGKPYDWLVINSSLTISRNKINSFTEYIDDYSTGSQKAIRHNNTDIAFSPSLTGFVKVDVKPFPHASLRYSMNYTGRQYLDNTSQSNRSLNPFFTQDLLIDYAWKISKKITSTFFVQVNNIFSGRYEPNGYTYSYYEDATTLRTMNYYYPMAPINFLAGIKLQL